MFAATCSITTAGPGEDHAEGLTVDLSQVDFQHLREEFAKTRTAWLIAAVRRERGQRLLIIDTDTQARAMAQSWAARSLFRIPLSGGFRVRVDIGERERRPQGCKAKAQRTFKRNNSYHTRCIMQGKTKIAVAAAVCLALLGIAATAEAARGGSGRGGSSGRGSRAGSRGSVGKHRPGRNVRHNRNRHSHNRHVNSRHRHGWNKYGRYGRYGWNRYGRYFPFYGGYTGYNNSCSTGDCETAEPVCETGDCETAAPVCETGDCQTAVPVCETGDCDDAGGAVYGGSSGGYGRKHWKHRSNRGHRYHGHHARGGNRGGSGHRGGGRR